MKLQCGGILSDGQFYRLIKKMREDKLIHMSGSGSRVLYFEGAKHELPDVIVPSPKLIREEKIANQRVLDKLREASNMGDFWCKYLEVASESCA